MSQFYSPSLYEGQRKESAASDKIQEEITKNTLQALLKETELLRVESILFIGLLRRMLLGTIAVTSLMVPLLTNIFLNRSKLNMKEFIGPVSDYDMISIVIEQNKLLIFPIFIGSSIIIAILLLVYTAIFKQIFMVAAYYRSFLAPEINKIIGGPAVMQWEYWLQERRRDSKYGSMSLLLIEPIVMGIISIIFFLGALYLSKNDEWLREMLWIGAAFIFPVLIFSFVFLLRTPTDTSKGDRAPGNPLRPAGGSFAPSSQLPPEAMPPPPVPAAAASSHRS